MNQCSVGREWIRSTHAAFIARTDNRNYNALILTDAGSGRIMSIAGKTLDDVLRQVFKRLLNGNLISPSKGPCWEETGVLLEIANPRARLSRTETRGRAFSALGEFLWYMSGSNRLDFILHYIDGYETDDGETIHGGYGPRLFNLRGCNQIENVVSVLSERPYSRRAVIQLFDAEDLARHYKDIPCTCSLQFLIRGNKLHLIVSMRSNDAYLGLPHDVFCFTMLQEYIATILGVELGVYRHFVGSLHLYTKHEEGARQYLDEGYQSTVPMPEMPAGDPRPAMRKLLDAEDAIRQGRELNAGVWTLAPYWADLIRLLLVFAASGEEEKIDALKRQMAFSKYAPYIEGRKVTRRRPKDVRPTQLRML